MTETRCGITDANVTNMATHFFFVPPALDGLSLTVAGSFSTSTLPEKEATWPNQSLPKLPLQPPHSTCAHLRRCPADAFGRVPERMVGSVAGDLEWKLSGV